MFLDVVLFMMLRMDRQHGALLEAWPTYRYKESFPYQSLCIPGDRNEESERKQRRIEDACVGSGGIFLRIVMPTQWRPLRLAISIAGAPPNIIK